MSLSSVSEFKRTKKGKKLNYNYWQWDINTCKSYNESIIAPLSSQGCPRLQNNREDEVIHQVVAVSMTVNTGGCRFTSCFDAAGERDTNTIIILDLVPARHTRGLCPSDTSIRA